MASSTMAMIEDPRNDRPDEDWHRLYLCIQQLSNAFHHGKLQYNPDSHHMPNLREMSSIVKRLYQKNVDNRNKLYEMYVQNLDDYLNQIIRKLESAIGRKRREEEMYLQEIIWKYANFCRLLHRGFMHFLQHEGIHYQSRGHFIDRVFRQVGGKLGGLLNQLVSSPSVMSLLLKNNGKFVGILMQGGVTWKLIIVGVLVNLIAGY